ncbi:hypothetical protein PC121_g374 [Phytophthora cactorum]|nr:hypothetical protein PC121_g374 [Phytophthora cactorum]
MVDKELVRGMLLTQCQQDTCDACHLGKQKRKAHRKKLDRATKEPNQVVYADLLIPGKSNATRYEAVLVILDGYSRFMTVHLLKDKDSKVVNKHMREYVHWAERQAGRSSSGQTYKVKPILSDKGGEFFNEEIDAWYDAKGIEHVKVGPKSSQLNLCERSHQSLEGMTKATLAHAGFPRSLWPEAIRNAAYVKNRVYNKGTKGIPYEMMFGVKPDIHHIRKFGALAYVHVSASPARKKHDPNVKIGFVLGYAEAVVGCKVYFPNEHTAKFVPDLRVAENVVYRDRHAAEVEEDDLSSLHFTHRDDEEQTTECEEEGMNEPSDEESRGLEEGEYDNDVEMDEEEHVDIMIRERVVGNIERHEEPEEPEVSEHSDGEHHEEGDKRREEHDTEVVDGTEVVDDSHLGEGKQSDTVDGEVAEQQEAVDSEAQSVTEEDSAATHDEGTSTSLSGDAGVEGHEETEDTQPFQRQTGKWTHRDETPSEEMRIHLEAGKKETKKTRTGLREYHERKRPNYLDDYVMNVTLKASRILDKNGRPIRASNIKIPPKSPRDAAIQVERVLFDSGDGGNGHTESKRSHF